MPAFIDLSWQRFTRWQVSDYYERRQQPNGRTEILWLCICDCGVYAMVRAKGLRDHTTTGCGCAAIERLKARLRKKVRNKDHELYEMNKETNGEFW